MALVTVAEFKGINLNNLFFDEDVLKSFNTLNNEDKVKVITILGTLNEHGLSYDHFRKRIERLSGKYKKITELKVKNLSKREWRFLVIPVKQEGKETRKYAVLHSFLKQSTEIKEADKKKAYLVARREDLL